MSQKQFRLRTLLLLTPFVCVLLAVCGTKIRQDGLRRKAFMQIGAMGFLATIGEPGGLQFRYERPLPLSNGEAEIVIGHLQTLRRRYDLGLSVGDEIGLIDFGGSGQDQAVVELFKERFPTTSVKR